MRGDDQEKKVKSLGGEEVMETIEGRRSFVRTTKRVWQTDKRTRVSKWVKVEDLGGGKGVSRDKKEPWTSVHGGPSR